MKTLHVFVASATLALASAVSASANAAAPIRIGALNPYSGPMALYGTEVTRGYELAVDKVNAEGGINGRKIELLRGDVSTPQQGITTVEQMVTKDHVDVFVGTYLSAVSLTASDAAQRYNKLYWETNAVAQNLTQRGLPNFIRSGPNAEGFATTSSDVVRDLVAPGLKKNIRGLKVWIEHEDSAYGTSVADEQKRILESFGANVVGMAGHPASAIDLNDSVLRAKKADPDVVIQTGYVSDTNLLLRTMRDQGFKPGAIVLVGTGDTPETLQALGAKYLDGIVVVGYPRSDIAESYGPGAKQYVDAYRTKFHSDPIAPQGMAAYSGMLILTDVLKAAGSVDPAKVRAVAAKFVKPEHSFPSGFGVKFDKNFQNLRAQFTGSQWQGGRLVTVYPKEAVLPGVTVKPLGRP